MALDDTLFSNSIELIKNKPLLCAYHEIEYTIEGITCEIEKSKLWQIFEDEIFDEYRPTHSNLNILSKDKHMFFNKVQDLKEELGYELLYN